MGLTFCRWKVVRPGVNKAFFVPAQYVQVVFEKTESRAELEEGLAQPSEARRATESPSPSSSPETDSKRSEVSKKSEHSSGSVKMKRGDSTRASKKAMRVKNWSASLEELSKQIKFPGIDASESSESVTNLSCVTARPISNSNHSKPCASDEKNCKPIPLPRKSVSEGGARGRESSPANSTPKPIPKARSKYVISDGSSGGNKSTSGGSSEVLTATSSEELLLTSSSPTTMALRNNNYRVRHETLFFRIRFKGFVSKSHKIASL